MKSFTAIISILSAATALAAPLAQPQNPPPTATISLSNDINGANAAVILPLDGSVHNIEDLFYGTGIDIFRNTPGFEHSSFQATSASLIGGYSNNPLCVIDTYDGGLQKERIQGVLDTTAHTWLRFSAKEIQEAGGRLMATELRAAYIQCSFDERA